ncbi:MAG: zf-HC2 domain-containing protein [Gemmatimonadales bacterium]
MTAHLTEERLNGFADGTLPERERREAAAHLADCAECRAGVAGIRAVLAGTAALPRSVEPPRDLWPDIAAGLRDPEAASASRVPRRAPAVARRVALAAAAGLAAVLVARSLFLPRGWDVAPLAGLPRIGDRALAAAGHLRVGEWLVTDDRSRARLHVGAIGELEVDPGTRLRIAVARPTEHRLTLAHGAIAARVNAPPRIFVVETPAAVAVDLGCAYRLEVDSLGNGRLHVTAGLVELVWGDRTSIVPIGVLAPTRQGYGPGVPFVEDAPARLRAALAELEFERRGRGRAALEAVLAAARRADGISLWHLLARVDPELRARVYDRLAELVPPPPEVTREGILRLDRSMLDTYWNYIPGTVWRRDQTLLRSPASQLQP